MKKTPRGTQTKETLCETMGEIYKDQRPRAWAQMLGQDAVVSLLKSQLAKGKVPHTLLFHGPTGTGKTTAARILAAKLNDGKASKEDVVELNCAGEARGIDSIRALRESFRKRSFKANGKRVYILDECFHPKSMVATSRGWIPIGTVVVGDCVYGADGLKRVQHIFRNRVVLHRVVRVDLSNGRAIYCSEDHKFLTESGWLEAKHLQGAFILSDNCYPMRENGSCIGVSHASKNENVHLSSMRGAIYSGDTIRVTRSDWMQQELHNEADQCSQRLRADRGSEVCGVREDVRSTPVLASYPLQPVLCGGSECEEPRDTSGSTFASDAREDKPSRCCLYENSGGGEALQTVVEAYEESQSYALPRERTDDDRYSNEEWDAYAALRQSWRQRKADSRADIIERESRSLLGIRSCDSHEKEKSLPDELQSGHRASQTEDCDRGRWENAFIEKAYIARCQEDPTAAIVRVDRVTVYERGRTDSDFVGIIGDQEVSDGYITFCDLEVEGHPSYHVEGVPVHNCHRLTADSVEALLKMTEDTPKYVYVVLCSSLPEKLPASLRGRASKYKFERGSIEDIRALLKREAERYSIPLSDSESLVVAEAADGSYREALVTLNSLRFAEDAKHRKALLRRIEESVDTSALCRALLSGGGVKSWSKVKECLVALRGTHDAESVRWRILEYMVAVALKQSSVSSILSRAVWVSSCFSESCRDSGYSGLVTASFAAMGGK